MSRLTRANAYDYKLEQIADEYELEPNPAPGPKWKALRGIPRIPNLCGATQSLLECVVELAHDHWGFAFPSREHIQLWTGRSLPAIKRALAKAKRLGLITTVERRENYERSSSTLIFVNWEPLFAACERVELFRRKAGGWGSKSSRGGVRNRAMWLLSKWHERQTEDDLSSEATLD
jgi:hypothetical protein